MNRPWPSGPVAALVISTLIALAYGASLGNELVFDDAIFMERDPRVQSFTAAGSLLVEPLWGFQDAPGRGGIHQYYRPAQLMPLVLANQWFGGAAWPCHAISLLMHLGISLLVFSLLSTVTQSRSISLLLAAVFAVHPAGSEAVLWASDFAGLGVALAMLATLALHARARGTALTFLGVSLLSLFGMFSKESGILIAPTMLLLDLLLGARLSSEHTSPRSRSARAAAYFGVAISTAVYLILRRHALGGMLPGTGQLELTGPELAINAVALLPSYVATYFWPFDLNMYHDFDPVGALHAPSFLVGIAIVAAWAVATGLSLQKHRGATFGLLFAALAVAPYLLVRWPQLNAYAERYTYLPSFGLLLATADVFGQRDYSVTARRTLALACVAILACFILVDRQRTLEWHDEVSIYERTLEQSPRAELIRNNLALRYLARGEPELGIPLQERLLELDPDFRSGWHNLGLLYLADDRRDDALLAFEKAVQQEPANPASWLNLGYVRDAIGQRVGAIDAYFRALLFDPRETKAIYNLAVIALEMGQVGNAVGALTQMQVLAPTDGDITALLANARSRQRRAPVSAVTQALGQQLKVGRQAVEARRWIEAETALRTATWLDERAHLPHHYLANAYYLRGKTADALRSERAAAERAPNNALYKKNVASLEATTKGDANAPSPFATR